MKYVIVFLLVFILSCKKESAELKKTRIDKNLLLGKEWAWTIGFGSHPAVFWRYYNNDSGIYKNLVWWVPPNDVRYNERSMRWNIIEPDTLQVIFPNAFPFKWKIHALNDTMMVWIDTKEGYNFMYGDTLVWTAN